MPVSLLLAQEIAKLFLILLLGVAVVRAGLLHAADSRVLSVILVYLIVPCVILNAFQIEDTPELRAGLLFALGAAVLIHLLFLALTLALRRPLKLDAVERATVIYSNAGALVIPLVQALQGQAYVIYSCAFIIVQLVLLWALGLAGLIPDGKAILMTVFLAAITPACATLTSMAQLYDCDVRKASSLYVLSTLLSILTMPVMIGLYDLVI